MTDRATRESFTPNEEALIHSLRNQPTQIIMAELLAAGFPDRSPESIRKKRSRVQPLTEQSSRAELAAALDTLEAAKHGLEQRRIDVAESIGMLNRMLIARVSKTTP